MPDVVERLGSMGNTRRLYEERPFGICERPFFRYFSFSLETCLKSCFFEVLWNFNPFRFQRQENEVR